ncbi:hypothetical protein ARALYDRAFT_888834 [Arabidopsis lyrata subsp. lyrata]|uniref:Uncharacterized protein n=1 Tax=Arabidopsis lyrata subsp. lyrata TaxID=81972 RepID=D7KBL5_ARALL|nr:hypothetical protein ARALYDRAFT_888834 [Arabidopsis lyrata subsp. lyrata]
MAPQPALSIVQDLPSCWIRLVTEHKPLSPGTQTEHNQGCSQLAMFGKILMRNMTISREDKFSSSIHVTPLFHISSRRHPKSTLKA